MKIFQSTLCALAFLCLTTASDSAAALNNGDFNTGSLPGWWGYTTDPNQSVTVLPADAFSYDNSPYARISDHSSPAAAAAVLGQEVDLSGGSQFSISLAYRANNWGGGGVGVWYWDSSWSQIGWEWTSLYTGDGTDTGWQSFTSPTWTAPAGTAHLSVRLDAWSWSDTFYDNVSLAVVPEPGTMAFLGMGVFVWLINRRRS